MRHGRQLLELTRYEYAVTVREGLWHESYHCVQTMTKRAIGVRKSGEFVQCGCPQKSVDAACARPVSCCVASARGKVCKSFLEALPCIRVTEESDNAAHTIREALRNLSWLRSYLAEKGAQSNEDRGEDRRPERQRPRAVFVKTPARASE